MMFNGGVGVGGGNFFITNIYTSKEIKHSIKPYIAKGCFIFY